MEGVARYFPELTAKQVQQFELLGPLYTDWNQKINLISRKDMHAFYERHVLHSLGIARVLAFRPMASVLDVGTGGGFPGIPLAILFPGVQFTLVDSIGKKMKVVRDVVQQLNLVNVTAIHGRAEELTGTFDFVISRAVTSMPVFVSWVKNRFNKQSSHALPNGILYLKGGDLTEELSKFPKAEIYPLSVYFEEAFFETKSVVYLRASDY